MLSHKIFDEILYHGSYISVPKVDLNKCEKGKDFGQGFYTTTSYIQARNFIATSIKKAIRDKRIGKDEKTGFVSKYKINADTGNKIKIYEFAQTDEKWLKCIASNRTGGKCFKEEGEIIENYDIIIGKIADDKTNAVIQSYIDGVYGDIESLQAIKLAISFLEPENLQNQICFRTLKSINKLVYIGGEVI